MADVPVDNSVVEDFQNAITSFSRPIPGMSLAESGQAEYEKAPKITSIHVANEYLWTRLIEPKRYKNLMLAVNEGVPILDIARAILYSEFTKGTFNPDLMLLATEPLCYMIIALAERLGIEYIFVDEDDEEEEELDTMESNPALGLTLTDDKIARIKQLASGNIISSPAMPKVVQEQIDELPSDMESLLASPPTDEEPVEQEDSLLAKQG
jgi:hypothetical protein